ncbi:hypothetical protein ID866_8118 [Astraeus odoratus]|nr:hypothetical protein ID866_8118 [Astraeus odoratus]
MCQGMFPASS